MRATTTPAQITTVEDRIAGSLGMSQVALLFVPFFLGSVLYVALPPDMHNASYKLAVFIFLVCVCGALAIRVKGVITLFWIAILFRYWTRPRYYVFDKRSMCGRREYRARLFHTTEETIPHLLRRARSIPPLSPEDVIRIEDIMNSPSRKVAFEIYKGGIYVRITEVSQKG